MSMIFRREMRRDERRDVVEVAAVGEAVHTTNKEHEEQAALAQAQAAAQAQAPEQAATTEQSTDAAAPAPAAASAADLTDEQISELERVAKLKEEGILTDEEFAAEKKKILGL
jgi:hypothetical protein